MAGFCGQLQKLVHKYPRSNEYIGRSNKKIFRAQFGVSLRNGYRKATISKHNTMESSNYLQMQAVSYQNHHKRYLYLSSDSTSVLRQSSPTAEHKPESTQTLNKCKIATGPSYLNLISYKTSIIITTLERKTTN